MAYIYDPRTGEFVNTVRRGADRPTAAAAPVRAARTASSSTTSRTRRQDPRTVMSTVYGGTSRHGGGRSEYFKWWILRMCVYVGIAMLFNLCSR